MLSVILSTVLATSAVPLSAFTPIALCPEAGVDVARANDATATDASEGGKILASKRLRELSLVLHKCFTQISTTSAPSDEDLSDAEAVAMMEAEASFSATAEVAKAIDQTPKPTAAYHLQFSKAAATTLSIIAPLKIVSSDDAHLRRMSEIEAAVHAMQRKYEGLPH